MALKFATTLRTARAQAIITALDAGSEGGKILIYTGTQPSAGASITTQTLLATCTLSKPSATLANGVLTFSPITEDSLADATGTIAWARVTDSSGTFVLDMAAGLTGSELIFNTLAVQEGGAMQILNGSITEGNM
jgi:hypothetical protein